MKAAKTVVIHIVVAVPSSVSRTVRSLVTAVHAVQCSTHSGDEGKHTDWARVPGCYVMMADLLRTRQPGENEDFYKLLGCDETSTVRDPYANALYLCT